MAEEPDLASIVRIELSSLPKDVTIEQVEWTIRACLVRELRERQDRGVAALPKNLQPAVRSLARSQISRLAEDLRQEIMSLEIKASPCKGDQRFEATLRLSEKLAGTLNVTTPFEV